MSSNNKEFESARDDAKSKSGYGPLTDPRASVGWHHGANWARDYIFRGEGEKRWVVSCTSKHAVDDWACGDTRRVFDNEKEALDFVEKNKHKGKPFYWQPSVWVEELTVRIEKKWRVFK